MSIVVVEVNVVVDIEAVVEVEATVEMVEVSGVAERSSSQGGLGWRLMVLSGVFSVMQVKWTSTYLLVPGHGSPNRELDTGTEHRCREPHLRQRNSL